MDWNRIKEELYYVNGSLRDILVLNTDEEDWRRWVELVNARYVVEFYNGPAKRTESWIDFSVIRQQWASPDEVEWSIVRIQVRGYTINCHFFWEGDIENDVYPADFQTLEDHEDLLAYLRAVSAALGKPVRLTPENTEEMVLLEVSGADVRWGFPA